MRVHYAIVYVSDMKRSASFYRDTVGLTLRFESPGWTEFATEGAILVLHPGEGSGATPVAGVVGTWGSGFRVSSLDEFHRRMVAAGVRCAQQPREVFGARVAQYVDPDGLTFSVGEDRA